MIIKCYLKKKFPKLSQHRVLIFLTLLHHQLKEQVMEIFKKEVTFIIGVCGPLEVNFKVINLPQAHLIVNLVLRAYQFGKLSKILLIKIKEIINQQKCYHTKGITANLIRLKNILKNMVKHQEIFKWKFIRAD